MEWSELARCLLTLKSISSNDECLDDVLQGLVMHTQSLLKRFQQVPPATDIPLDPHKCLSGLLHTLISVSYFFLFFFFLEKERSEGLGPFVEKI
jgi:hypothetical protein